MAIITNTINNNNNAATTVRQLSVTCEGNLAGFFNVSSTVTVELAELGNWLTQNQSKLTWEKGETAKGKLQYVCKANSTILGWYQPGANQHEGELTFAARREISSTANLDSLL